VLDKPTPDRFFETEASMIAPDANPFLLHAAVPPGCPSHSPSPLPLPTAGEGML
jgi:hypothetical protein